MMLQHLPATEENPESYTPKLIISAYAIRKSFYNFQKETAAKRKDAVRYFC